MNILTNIKKPWIGYEVEDSKVLEGSVFLVDDYVEMRFNLDMELRYTLEWDLKDHEHYKKYVYPFC